MQVNKVIERAEKHRFLGRFDKTSAISFINDAIYEILQRQSVYINYTFEDFTGGDLTYPGIMIRFNSITLDPEPEEDRYRVDVKNHGVMSLHKKDEGEWVKIEQNSIDPVDVIAELIAFIPVTITDTEFYLPIEYETAVVYYIRHKMLEEIGELEQSQYYFNQYSREIIMKASPKRTIISKPSEFSLL